MPLIDLSWEDRVPLPAPIVHRRVGEKHLFIATENPCWISTSEAGALLMVALREQYSIGEACGIASKMLSVPLEAVIEEAQVLLGDIHRHGFHSKTTPTPPLRTATLHMYLTRRCNLRCPYCYMDAGPEVDPRQELDTAAWKGVLDAFASYADADPRINFSGGEPLLRPDLLTLAAYGKELGFYNKLFTNGSLIGAHNIDPLCEAFDSVQITIDGATTGAHGRTRGRTFEAIKRALDLLATRDVKVDIAVSVFPENVEDLQRNLVPFLRSLAPNRHDVYLSYDLFLLGRGADAYDKVYEDFFSHEANALVNGIIKDLEGHGFKSSVYFEMNLMLDNCGIGTVVGVNANGDVFPCSLPYPPVGNVRTDDLLELVGKIRALAEETTVDRIPECQACDLRNICLGGCRMSNMVKYGSYLSTGCTPARREKKYRQMADMMPVNMEK